MKTLSVISPRFVESVFFCSLLALIFSFAVYTQESRTKRSTWILAEPNLHAPNLYADNLQMKVALVNLPGAAQAGSNITVAYKLYFVPEAEFEGHLRRTLESRKQPTFEPSLYNQKILIAEGEFKSNNLATIKNRILTRANLPFRSKVSEPLRTKSATLLTSYTVKIYDAKLKSTIYDNGVFVTKPFTQNEAGQVIPRTDIYLNFFVTPDGKLFNSQSPRSDGSTEWRVR